MTRPGMVATPVNPVTWEAEAGSQVYGQPQPFSKTLTQNIKIKGWRCSSGTEYPWVQFPVLIPHTSQKTDEQEEMNQGSTDYYICPIHEFHAYLRK